MMLLGCGGSILPFSAFCRASTFVVLIVAPILLVFWNICILDLHRTSPDAKSKHARTRDRQLITPLVIYVPPPDSLSKETPSFPHIYSPKPTKQQMRFRLELQTNFCNW